MDLRLANQGWELGSIFQADILTLRKSAFYSFHNGISGYFESHPQSADITTATDTKLTRSSRSFGFEVYGTEGIISIRSSPCSEFYQYPHGRWIPDGIDGNWERVIIDDWDIRPDGSLYTANERSDMSNKIAI